MSVEKMKAQSLRDRLRPAMERIEEQRTTGKYPRISPATLEKMRIIVAGDRIIDAGERAVSEMRKAG